MSFRHGLFAPLLSGRRTGLVVLLGMLCCSSTRADDTANPAVPRPIDPQDNAIYARVGPVNAPPADPAVAALLERAEQRSTRLKSVRADMTYTLDQLMLETREVRQGSLLYRVDDQQVQFRLHFDSWRQVDLEADEPAPVVPIDLDYAFDGRWLIKRDTHTKMIQRWELAKTPRDREAFRLGRGPFPLPFSLRKADVLANFEASLAEPTEQDPAGTDHLVLVPLPESTYAQDYRRMDLWIERARALPVQLRFEKQGFEVTMVTWRDIKLDVPIDARQFELAPPGPDWSVEVTPLPPDEPPATP